MQNNDNSHDNLLTLEDQTKNKKINYKEFKKGWKIKVCRKILPNSMELETNESFINRINNFLVNKHLINIETICNGTTKEEKVQDERVRVWFYEKN